MPDRAVIYARVSTDTQRDNTSPGWQLRRCAEYAKQRGYKLVDPGRITDRRGQIVAGLFDPETAQPAPEGIPAFVDDTSGADIKRPGLDAMFDYIEEHHVTVVVALTVDRMARDYVIIRDVKEKLEDRHARLEYADRVPSGDEDQEDSQDFMQSYGAREYRKSLGKNTARGRKARAEAGKYVFGSLPYGYMRDESVKSGLALDPVTAPIVAGIFADYIGGKSIRGITQSLNVEEVSTPRTLKSDENNGGRLVGARIHEGWSRSTIGKLLQSTCYYGEFFYGKVHVKKHWRGNVTRVARDESEWIRLEVPAIVTREVWDAAQVRLKESTAHVRNRAKRLYLLNGRIFCAKCGGIYSAQTYTAGSCGRARDMSSYRHRPDKGTCKGHQISGAVLEPYVWQVIGEAVKDPASVKRHYLQAINRADKDHARLDRQIATTKVTIARLHERIDKLTTNWLDTGMAKGEYTERRSGYESEIAVAEESLQSLQVERGGAPNLAKFDYLAGILGDWGPWPHFYGTGMDDNFAWKEVTEEEGRKRITEAKRLMDAIGLRVEIDGDNKAVDDTGWRGTAGIRVLSHLL